MIVNTGPSMQVGAKAHLRSDVFQRSSESCTMTFYYNMNAVNSQVYFLVINPAKQYLVTGVLLHLAVLILGNTF